MQLQNAVCQAIDVITGVHFVLTRCQNAALQLAMKDRDVLRGLLEVSKMNVTTQQQRVISQLHLDVALGLHVFQADTLEQRLRELDEEKNALTRELQAAAQIVRVDVGPFMADIYKATPTNIIQAGVNTNPLSTPRDPANVANFPVVQGPSTAGPSRDRNPKEERDLTADIVVVYPPSQLPSPRKQAIENAPQLIPDLPDGGTVCFTRLFLTANIGGGSQALISK